MKANAGGQIDIYEVRGRDALIASFWDILSRQSLLLTAERRIGKTTILKKMEAQPPKGIVPIYQDLEGITTPEEFTESVAQRVKKQFKPFDLARHEGSRLVNRFGGAEVKGVKLPPEKQSNWKSELPALFEKASARKEARPVLFWDELPLMLYNIKRRHGAEVAMDVLDVIRNLRQSLDVRMVLTGSIGLHHIIDSLKIEGYSNAPMNDLYRSDVPPLELEDAVGLAEELLAGEGLKSNDSDNSAVAERIAEVTGCLPFYIHNLIVRLKIRRKPFDTSTISQVADESLSLTEDPWNMRHYRDRLKTYYGTNQLAIASSILDSLSIAAESLTFEKLFNITASKTELDNRELFKEIVRSLEMDHYLTGSAESGYRFQTALVKRWWQQSK